MGALPDRKSPDRHPVQTLIRKLNITKLLPAMHTRKKLVVILALACCIGNLYSDAQPTISYRRIISAVPGPLEVACPPDGTNRLFVVQKSGTIKVYDNSYSLTGDFLTVSGITTNGERGLLSMTFHPSYVSNGYFFVYYTNLQGDIEVARYTVSPDPNKADTNTRKIIITIPHRAATNHNGGKLSFGPDGYLYFATGDGGNGGDPPNNAQNGRVLLGKMIRIDINNTSGTLNYAIPPDNPYVNDTTIADEIWAMGLRNPFRWSFDRRTHDMWIADVGQGVREEINFRKAGESGGVNYGWRCYEGKIPYNPAGCKPADQYTPPIFDYPHNLATGGSSVTGGYVYRGSAYPALNGYYIFADYISNNQWMISDSANTWIMRQQPGPFPRNIAGFGEGGDGTIYACSLTENAVYKLEASTGVLVNLLDFAGAERYGFSRLSWRATEQDILQYEIEGSLDSFNFNRELVIPAKNETENNYEFTENIRHLSKKFYRLRILGSNGKWDYSKTIVVRNDYSLSNFVFPSVIRSRQLSFYISDTYDQFFLFSLNGSVVFRKNIRGLKGKVEVPLSNMARGIYLVKISNARGFRTQWVYVE
jgi:glucose/arabinose dehydrogenase